MMRIVHLLEDGRFAGPQSWAWQICRYLNCSSGENAFVVFGRQDSEVLSNRLKMDGIAFYRCSLHGLGKGKLKLFIYLLTFVPELFRLISIIRKNKTDIVHCHNVWQYKAALAGKISGAKVIWHIHETWMPGYVKALFRLLAFFCADGFVTAGECAREYHLGIPCLSKKPVLVVQSPVDTSKFDPNSVESETKHAVFRGIRVVTIGNINPFKGLEFFIEMSAILGRKYNGIHFCVVGPVLETQREYLRSLNELIKDHQLKNYHWVGPTDNIPSVLSAADIYVCSSVYEASPTVVWEAMSMGKPVVATNVGDVSTFIENGRNGYIVPPSDAMQLAEHVGRLIESPPLREQLGLAARRTAIEHLDVVACMERQMDFYRQLMSRAK